jgi:hypothetical protein
MNAEWKDLSEEFHKGAAYVVEIEERFLHWASRRVRTEANAKKRRRLASVEMTILEVGVKTR